MHRVSSLHPKRVMVASPIDANGRCRPRQAGSSAFLPGFPSKRAMPAIPGLIA